MNASFSCFTNGHLRGRIARVYAALILFNLLAWVWALYLFRDQPLLLGTALLAYGFGLRHAIDADHIAAIDNVTRKLMQAGQRPVSVGLFFALGHSSVVIFAVAAMAVTATALAGSFVKYRIIGGVIGTGVSAIFLLIIAAANLIVLFSVWRIFQHVRRGGRYEGMDVDRLLNSRGFLARVLRPVLHLVTRSWHMLPLGFLFGLGFDTATEIALLGVAATQAAHGMPTWSIMVFPTLFAAGMSLVDTTDGILMLGAYDWALIRPMRRLYYNLTITGASVLVAGLIGSIEALGLIGDRWQLSGIFWADIAGLNDSFGMLGFLIITLFVAAWAVSILVYRYKGLDEVDVQ
jgi:high-affinity nickel-transport protein